MDLETEVASGGANHQIDDETGKPFWELWGEGWKDSTSMDVNEVMKLDPRNFPPGTRIVVIEPFEDERAKAFYGRVVERKKFYPLKGKMLERMLELNNE